MQRPAPGKATARLWARTEKMRFGLSLLGVVLLFYGLSLYDDARMHTADRVIPPPTTSPVVEDPEPLTSPPVEVAAVAAPPTVAPAEWAWWGDSLTAGVGGDGAHAPGILSGLLGEPVFNFGVGGERSAEIAARANGTPAQLTIEGGLIPASGGVRVVPDVNLLLHGPRALNGEVAGIPGRLTLDRAVGAYTFIRDTDGDAVAADVTAFLTSSAEEYRAHNPILWLGRNNYAETDRILADVASIIAYSTGDDDRFMVLSILNGGIEEGAGTPSHAAITATNVALAERWPDHYVDVRRCLIDTSLQRSGIVPTTEDTATIAADAVPPSLRVDGIHLTAVGYTVVAECVRDWMVDRAWIDGLSDVGLAAE